MSRLPRCCGSGARQQPDGAGPYTYIDYEIDPAGYSPERSPGPSLYGRVQALGAEGRVLAERRGNRAGHPSRRRAWDYVVAFYAALEGPGFVAVPLPVPAVRRPRRAGLRGPGRTALPTVLLTTTRRRRRRRRLRRALTARQGTGS